VAKLSLSLIQSKAKHFCAYQERTHLEVSRKLYGYGLQRKEVESTIALLIEENYLNEERFAVQFAGGRFRLKKWGRIKIMQELKQRKVSIYNINTALSKLDEDVYMETLNNLAIKKLNTLKADIPLIKKQKTVKYLLQKGYEKQLILEALDKLIGR
jgi:regulatory protein